MEEDDDEIPYEVILDEEPSMAWWYSCPCLVFQLHLKKQIQVCVALRCFLMLLSAYFAYNCLQGKIFHYKVPGAPAVALI